MGLAVGEPDGDKPGLTMSRVGVEWRWEDRVELWLNETSLGWVGEGGSRIVCSAFSETVLACTSTAAVAPTPCEYFSML